jgi:hypothetical protein
LLARWIEPGKLNYYCACFRTLVFKNVYKLAMGFYWFAEKIDSQQTDPWGKIFDKLKGSGRQRRYLKFKKQPPGFEGYNKAVYYISKC